MQIDWITVSAQIVNFLILVWLLRHFLYQPVMQAMERREQRITERLSQAQQREQQADEKLKHYQSKTEALEDKREQLLSEAREQAGKEKKQLLEQARETVAETRDHWQQQAEQEKADFFRRLRRDTADAVQAIARKALHDLADASLEQQLIDKFMEELKNADKETRAALADSSQALHIHSAYELESTVRARLTRFIHEHVVADVEIVYSTSPDLFCGISLISGDRRLGWNLNEYLDELNERLQQAFSSAATDRKKED